MTVMRLFLLGMVASVLGAYDLMPVPAKVVAGEGRLVIDRSFRVELTGYSEPPLPAAVSRLVDRLVRKTGIPITGGTNATLVIHCAAAGEDESYRLEITPREARLEASAPPGVLHGIETFLQLVEDGGSGFHAPAVRIEDAPRFPWRGLLIDSARHFLPVEVLERNLDAMAAVKMNVLHWHLSDDQGFRVESKFFPKLTGLGSDGRYYAQEQVRAVIAYAGERGIRVVPEFDMPGHTTAWFVGYPELASAPGPYQIERAWGIFNPCMDPTREEVYAFLDRFIGEMARLFPDPYFHIGGDEVNGKQWSASGRIQEFMRQHGMKNNRDLQTYFNKRVVAIVQKHGKRMVGWDEVLHPDLPKDIVVQSWRGQKSLAEAARGGYRGILSYGYYLDHMRPASYHYGIDPYADGAASLTDEEKARILGGEACMWAEYVSPENQEARVWPRAAAIAERLWSPQDVTDVDDMYRRLEITSRELERLGETHEASYRLMLERLAGDGALEPVQTLAEIVEPVKGYARGRARQYTQFTPLNRMVDAARPESRAAREFGKLVQARNWPQVRWWLARWRDNDERLRPMIRQSQLLQEVEPLSGDVAALAAAGLQAVDYLESGKPAPSGWAEEQKALLARARQPRAELLISIVPPVETLIQMVK